MANTEPLTPGAAKLVPVEGNRVVQVGTNDGLNFVIAVSIFVPLFTTPVKKFVAVALCQSRIAPAAELRTTLEIEPVLETFSKTPSTLPANFLPPSVSLLDPNSEVDPSAPRKITLNLLLIVPILISFSSLPALTKARDCPLSRDSKTDAPVLLTEIPSMSAD